jgi:hypothetical protein
MMKKFTLLFTFFTIITLLTAKAQPGVNGVFPYNQNFDSFTPAQIIEGQGGWYLDLLPLGYVNNVEVLAQRGINGTQAMSMHLTDNAPTDSTCTPLIGLITTNTTFGYSYRIVDAFDQPYTLTGNAGFRIQLKQDISPDWITIDSVSLSNHIDTNDYRRIEFPLATYAGMNVNFRFAFYQGNPGEDFFIDIDSLVITDPTITNNKSIQASQNNYNIFVSANNMINVSNRNNANNNNYISISDINGKLIYNSTINTNCVINASAWSKGIYFVNVIDNESTMTKKIIIQ